MYRAETQNGTKIELITHQIYQICMSLLKDTMHMLFFLALRSNTVLSHECLKSAVRFI